MSYTDFIQSVTEHVAYRVATQDGKPEHEPLVTLETIVPKHTLTEGLPLPAGAGNHEFLATSSGSGRPETSGFLADCMPGSRPSPAMAPGEGHGHGVRRVAAARGDVHTRSLRSVAGSGI